MGAPRAEKFTDYYKVLGVEPKADSDQISQAYQSLAKRFHPQNSQTGNAEKYAEVTEAFETLADPSSRAAFDSLRSQNVVDTTAPVFSGQVFFDSLGVQVMRRKAVLCVLYDRRRVKPFAASLSLRQLENLLQIDPEDLTFSVWYLKQRGLIVSDDKSNLQITVDGMDFLERDMPAPAEVAPYLSSPGLPPPAEAPDPPEPRSDNLAQLSLRIRALTRPAPETGA